MEQHEVLKPFEVYCHSCKVTFALGTKRCVHCGGRLARRGQVRGRARSGRAAQESAAAEAAGAPEIIVVEPETSGRPKLPISPITLLWILVIVGTFAQRACQDG